MGKGSGGGGGSSSETALTREQARISKIIFGESSPLRQALTGRLEQMAGLEPSFAPADAALFGPTAAERDVVESQFANARRNIEERAPVRGSDLNRAFADIEMGRAGSIVGLESQAQNRALDLASGVAYNTPVTALSGLNAARAGASSIADRQAQSDASLGVSIGKTALAIADSLK